MSEQFARVGELDICFETFGDPGDPAMLLIMGLGTQMVAWHDDFCAELAGRGFFVIRHDNRDIGRSTHLSQRKPPPIWNLPRPPLRSLHAGGHGRRQRRRARPPGDRAGAHRRRLDGRDDRPDGRDPYPERALSLVSLFSNTGGFLKRPAGDDHVRGSCCDTGAARARAVHQPRRDDVREDRRERLRAGHRGPDGDRHSQLRPRRRPRRPEPPARGDRRRPATARRSCAA